MTLDDGGLLLDTHTWIWLMMGQENQLTAAAVSSVEETARRGRVLISAISVWELSMLVAKGRIRLAKDVLEWVRDALGVPGVELLSLSPEISVESSRLPGRFHGDPADRILVATARVHQLTLVTKDTGILDYGREQYVKVMPA